MCRVQYVIARDEQLQHAALFTQAGAPVCLQMKNGLRNGVSCPSIPLDGHFIAPLSAPGLNRSVYRTPNFRSNPTHRSVPSP